VLHVENDRQVDLRDKGAEDRSLGNDI